MYYQDQTSIYYTNQLYRICVSLRVLTAVHSSIIIFHLVMMMILLLLLYNLLLIDSSRLRDRHSRLSCWVSGGMQAISLLHLLLMMLMRIRVRRGRRGGTLLHKVRLILRRLSCRRSLYLLLRLLSLSSWIFKPYSRNLTKLWQSKLLLDSLKTWSLCLLQQNE
jgi:hypothetical protein